MKDTRQSLVKQGARILQEENKMEGYYEDYEGLTDEQNRGLTEEGKANIAEWLQDAIDAGINEI